MTIDYVAAMPRREGLLGNPDGRQPVIEHALQKDSLRSLCNLSKDGMEMLHHEWSDLSPNSCKKCLRLYKKLNPTIK